MTTGTLPDYYGTLGVNPDADLATIRSAYRTLAKKWHPDRKGSHEMMVLVIQAWEILSDPVSRAHYDQARSHPADTQSWDVVREEAQQAETKAASYPQEWEEFERWQGDAWEEICQTKTVTPRLLFLLIGPAVVTALLREPASAILSRPGITRWISEQFPTLWYWFVAWACFALLLSMFAWIATAISGFVPALAPPMRKKTQSPSGSSPNHQCLPCLSCGTMLRFPKADNIRVTCPQCRFQSVHNG